MMDNRYSDSQMAALPKRAAELRDGANAAFAEAQAARRCALTVNN
jgi:hypothetical protein